MRLGQYSLVVVHSLGADVAADLPEISARVGLLPVLILVLLKDASLIKCKVKLEASLYGLLLLESLFCDVGIPAKRPPHLRMPGAA